MVWYIPSIMERRILLVYDNYIYHRIRYYGVLSTRYTQRRDDRRLHDGHYACVSRALYGTGPDRPRPAVVPRALVWY